LGCSSHRKWIVEPLVRSLFFDSVARLLLTVSVDRLLKHFSSVRFFPSGSSDSSVHTIVIIMTVVIDVISALVSLSFEFVLHLSRGFACTAVAST
jgi:hypothetical protein